MNEKISDWAKLLYDQSIIAEGRPVADPAAFLKRVNELLVTVSAAK